VHTISFYCIRRHCLAYIRMLRNRMETYMTLAWRDRLHMLQDTCIHTVSACMQASMHASKQTSKQARYLEARLELADVALDLGLLVIELLHLKNKQNMILSACHFDLHTHSLTHTHICHIQTHTHTHTHTHTQWLLLFKLLHLQWKENMIAKGFEPCNT
jgi:hypothetical protein